MNLIDVLLASVARLRARLLESLLVAAGLAAAVAVVASTLSLYRYVSASLGGDRQAREISVHAADASYSSAGPVARIETGASGAAPLTPEDIAAVRSVSPSVAAGYFRGLFAMSRGGEITCVVAGDYFAAWGLRVQEGTLFTAADESTGARVAVLGAGKARTLFPDGGAVGSTVTLTGLEYTVIGVLAPHAVPEDDGPRADDLAYIPVRSSLVFERMKSIPGLTFLAGSAETAWQAADEIRAHFEGRYGPGAVVLTMRLDEIERERERIRGVLTVLLLFGGAGLLIGSTNVLNVLLARAARRVRGTGIEMALGAPRRSILSASMAESLTLAVAACIVGLAMSLVFNALLGSLFTGVGAPGQRVTLTAPAALAGVGAALALNALLSAYPAIRSARLNAADAIRTE